MENVDGIIIQGDGLLFNFDHQPFCKFLARAKKYSISPKEIWKRISKFSLMYCMQTNIPNPLKKYNEGESLESFFEDVKRTLMLGKLNYEEFVHIWCSSIGIPSDRMHRMIPNMKVPIAAVVNTNHAHWERIRGYFTRNINISCCILSFEIGMTMPNTIMLMMAHKELGKRTGGKIFNPVYLGQTKKHLDVAGAIGISALCADDQNLPKQLENLGII